jgi:hypothetical protein
MPVVIRIRWRQVCRRIIGWLGQGVTPRRLALTLALGFAVGCLPLPLVGVPTLLCTALALTLKLKLPIILSANYAAFPFQLALAVPFARLGGRLLHAVPWPGIAAAHATQMTTRVAGLAGGALFAWLCLAIPAVVVITAVLTPMLRRIPRAAEAAAAGD